MDMCTWHDWICQLILLNHVHSSLQWHICLWVSRCAPARIRAHCSYDNKQIPVKQLRWIRERGGRVAAHVWRNIACCLSVCQDRLTESKRFAVKPRIYTVESGKSLTPSRHVLFFPALLFLSLLTFCHTLSTLMWAGGGEMSPPLPSQTTLRNTRQLDGSQLLDNCKKRIILDLAMPQQTCVHCAKCMKGFLKGQFSRRFLKVWMATGPNHLVPQVGSDQTNTTTFTISQLGLPSLISNVTIVVTQRWKQMKTKPSHKETQACIPKNQN